MNTIKGEIVKGFFSDKQEILDEMEKEMRKILVLQGLPFSLMTFRGMQVGMDMYCSAKLEMGVPQEIDIATISRMYVDYLVVTETEKINKIVDSNLK